MAQKNSRPVKKGGAKRGGAAKGLVVIAVLLLAFGIFWNNFTKIRVIEVTGVTLAEADQIARRSGITTGMRIDDIDEEAISRALSRLETIVPQDTVTVTKLPKAIGSAKSA